MPGRRRPGGSQCFVLDCLGEPVCCASQTTFWYETATGRAGDCINTCCMEETHCSAWNLLLIGAGITSLVYAVILSTSPGLAGQVELVEVDNGTDSTASLGFN